MKYNLNENEKFGAKLTLLQDILDKKQAALVAVLNICENQEMLHLAPPSDERNNFLAETTMEKQRQLDEVATCDEVFQSVFDTISDEFEQKSGRYSEKIEILQAGINEVLQVGERIRVMEKGTHERSQMQ